MPTSASRERSLSPAPWGPTARRSDLLFVEDEERSGRSSSLPPQNRVSFTGIHQTVPCSKEFQRSLNDLTRETDPSSNDRVKLPTIEVPKQSVTTGISSDSNKGKITRSGSKDSSDKDARNNGTSWMALSKAGLLTSAPARKKQVTVSEPDISLLNDDTFSIHSDSHVMISPRLRRRPQRLKNEVSSPSLSRRKLLTDSNEHVVSNTIQPLLSAASTGKSTPRSPSSPIPTSKFERNFESKSANNSPEQPRRTVLDTGSAPSSPKTSPRFARQTPRKKISDPSPWNKMPFNYSVNGYHTHSELNPILVKVEYSPHSDRDSSSCVNPKGPYSELVARNFERRGGRVHKDAWRLSDLCLNDHMAEPSRESYISLEDEFKKLKGCRYLRGKDDEKEDADAFLDEQGKKTIAGSL